MEPVHGSRALESLHRVWRSGSREEQDFHQDLQAAREYSNRRNQQTAEDQSKIRKINFDDVKFHRYSWLAADSYRGRYFSVSS